MNGIEILNKTPVYEVAEWALNTILFLLIVIPLTFIVYSIIKVIHGEYWSFIIENAVFGILVGLFVAVLFIVVTEKTGISQDKNNIAYYKYQITISDEVKFNDFMEEYEIVEQNGSIYTVRERD